MINLCKFSKMSFTELSSLPNYYIHEIYKQFAENNKAREKQQEEEKREQEAKDRANKMNMEDSTNVQNLRAALSGVNNNDLEDLLEDLS